jgi:hypothetical protein
MPYKDPQKRKEYSRNWKKTHKKANSEKKLTAPVIPVTANKICHIEIPALPPPKLGTEALPKVSFEAALLYITHEARSENVGVAKAWVLEFLSRGLGWSPERITLFIESREDRLLPIFHSPPPDIRGAWKLYQVGLYNPYITPHTHPAGVPDWGGFPLTELPNWYAFFTRWHMSLISADIPNSDRRKEPEQAKNLRGKRDSRDSRDSQA